MDKISSIYLDLLRFIAAIVVVIYHSSGEGITGGFLWQLNDYGHTAVIIFFVLSGYVIGFVTHKKEKCFSAFMVARLSRLYSVIIPALLLTLLVNFLGIWFISAEYTGPWNIYIGKPLEEYLPALFMVQNAWGVGLSPPNNGSFWSLSYEFAYYVLFACIFYLKKSYRFLYFLIISCIFGTQILLLFPVWLAGYYCYRLNSSNYCTLNATVSVLFYIAGLVIIIYSPLLRDFAEVHNAYVRYSTITDYIDALGFSLHLLGMPKAIQLFQRFLLFNERVIRRIASLTFAIYLFHLPLIRFFAGISPFINDPGSIGNILFVYSTTAIVIIVLGYPAERSKKKYMKFFEGLLNRYKS